MCRICCVTVAALNSFVLDSSASLLPHVWHCLMWEHCPLLILFYKQSLQNQFERCTFFSLLSPCAGGREEDSHRMWSWNHWLIIKSSAGLTHSPSQCYYCTIATLNLKHSKTVCNYNLPLLSNIQSDSPSSAWVETKSPTFPWQQKKHRNVTMAWSNGLVQCDLFADFCSICSADSAGRCSLCFIPVLQQDWKISLELC